MGPTWVLSAPDGPHVVPMNFAIRVWISLKFIKPGRRLYVLVAYFFISMSTISSYPLSIHHFGIIWRIYTLGGYNTWDFVFHLDSPVRKFPQIFLRKGGQEEPLQWHELNIAP